MICVIRVICGCHYAKLMSCDAQSKTGSVQRWRHRHTDHDYGPGTANATRNRVECSAACSSHAVFIRTELHLSRHLLEQSSSHAPHRGPGEWHHSLGKSASVVLAVTSPVRHELVWPEPFRSSVDGNVWSCTHPVRLCLYDSANMHHPIPGP